jgi:queuosine precursor transporter
MQTTEKRNYRFYDLILGGFVCALLCANLIGVQKVTVVNLPFYGQFIFGAGVLFFPISYLFGDILTEVYGYKRSRRVIWTGFAAMIFASFMAFVVVNLPVAPTMNPETQKAIESIFGQVPRIVLASLTAFWLGEFANSFVLAKMKILTGGKYLWTRTIGSTIAGETVDSLVFYPVAFYGIWSNEQVLTVMFSNFLLKVGWEVLATPFTYIIVNYLKKVENEDYYDRNTDFNPFSLET